VRNDVSRFGRAALRLNRLATAFNAHRVLKREGVNNSTGFVSYLDVVAQVDLAPFLRGCTNYLPRLLEGRHFARMQVGQLAPFVIASDHVIKEVEQLSRHIARNAGTCPFAAESNIGAKDSFGRLRN
jgi:hypothetical protein